MGGKVRRSGRRAVSGRGGAAGVDGGGDVFPWVVALSALVGALALLLHSTVPAVKEHRDLERIERERGEELRELVRERLDLRRRRQALPHDPEYLIVEFDRLGLMPEDAVARYGSGSGNESR